MRSSTDPPDRKNNDISLEWSFEGAPTLFCPWTASFKSYLRKKWQPTPIFLPRKFHGLRSLVGYSPWGRKESDMTERLHFLSGGSDSKESAWNEGDLNLIPGLGRSLRGGHDNPLQCSCLENPHEQRSLAGYKSMGLQRAGHDWATKHILLYIIPSCLFCIFSYVLRDMFKDCYFFHFLQVLKKLERLCLYKHNPRHFISWKEAALNHGVQGMLVPAHLWVWEQICHQSLAIFLCKPDTTMLCPVYICIRRHASAKTKN